MISGNKSDGLFIDSESDSNRVLGNRIGTTANGTAALGNGEAGVLLQGTSNTVGDGTAAGSNTIAFNAEDGVQVQTGIGNAIFSNAGLGIDLHGGFEDAQGNTANDPGDIDTGANGLQNKPVVSSATTSSTKTTIAVKLASAPDTSYTIEFYSNPSGNEGRKFVGRKIVTTDPRGNAAFTFSPAARIPVGQAVTATSKAKLVTLVSTSDEDTSEFSAPKTVASS